jgi:hypothetical protein
MIGRIRFRRTTEQIAEWPALWPNEYNAGERSEMLSEESIFDQKQAAISFSLNLVRLSS